MADLLIRAAMKDHLIVQDLLAAASGPRLAATRPPIGHLVADAHVAVARPSLAATARDAGVPFLVDPDTTLMQSDVDPEDRWAQLPFADASPLTAAAVDLGRLIEEVVELELDQGATIVIPPYFYASSPTDAWFRLSLDAITLTADYLSSAGIHLPMLPILCGQLQAFGAESAWPLGADHFARVSRDAGALSVAMCVSPAGNGADAYAKVRRLFMLGGELKGQRLRVVAWRQGVYGPALVAAGLDGYECGIGTGEQTNVVQRQSNRKPKADGKGGGGGGTGIFIEPLGRSVPRSIGHALLGDPRMRPKVMCDDESCCPSVASTLDKSGHHAIRTRSRILRDLAAQPHRRWRLNHVSRVAGEAVTLATQANRVLQTVGAKQRIHATNLAALARVTGELASEESGAA